MAKGDNITKIGKETRFKKGVSGNLNGRRPKLKTQLKKAGFTLCEVEDIMKSFLTLTPTELTEYYNKKDCSILEKILIKSLQKDLTSSQLINSVTILDRSYGKPKEKVESTLIVAERKTIKLQNGVEIEYE